MPRVHVSLSGHRLDYPDPTGPMAKFLRQLEKMLADPNVSADAMTGFAYSPANPMLDTDFFPERGPITKETFADPHYPVMQDMLARKRAAENGVNLDKIAATYTMTVEEAAGTLGMRASSLRNSILNRRIHSWFKDDGRHYLNPASVRAYEVGDQGGHRQVVERARAQLEATSASPASVVADTPKPADLDGGPLAICLGHMKGLSFRVKHPGALENKHRIGAHGQAGQLPRWKRVAVMVGKDRSREKYEYSLFLLTPSTHENEVLYEPFYVRGCFDLQKVTSPLKMHDMFQEFVAE